MARRSEPIALYCKCCVLLHKTTPQMTQPTTCHPCSVPHDDTQCHTHHTKHGDAWSRSTLPTTLIASPPEEPVKLTVPFVESFRQTMRDAHEQVRTATKSVARTQKTYFDKYVKGPPFHVGQPVWLYWPLPKLRQRHRKLTRLWTGSWQIMEFKTVIP